MRTKEKQMKIGNAEYFDNLNKEIKEKQNGISLSTSRVVAMKQMIANRDEEIEKLKAQLKTVRSLHDQASSKLMILSRKVVEMGYNPQTNMGSICMKGFQSLEKDPLNEGMIKIYNNPIWND